MIAIDPRKTWDYVLLRDQYKPCPDCTTRASEDAPCATCSRKRFVKTTKEERTVHHLRHLSVADEHRSFDGLEPNGNAFVRRDLGSDALRVLRLGYAGVTNFKDAQGNEVPFERGPDGCVSDAFLMRYRLADRMELARAVELELSVTEDELGKSGPPST